MLGVRFGNLLDKPLTPVAKKIGMSPNSISVAGFLTTTLAAAAFTWDLRVGAYLLLLGSTMDMLDGVVARVNDKVTDFGAFLDSVLDRYSDAFVFIGISWYFHRDGNLLGVALSLGTLVGAFLTSYARARAEGMGRECKVGLLERPERIVLVAFGALTGWMIEVLWVMLFLTHLTVVQRMRHVHKSLEY
jgi:CDP-diacylglycerol--glycerol-3-phosphate 3-phosphatidyltransferase